MKASVVLPVHNKAPWLQEALDSILAQTFGDFELIAVDDASTDGSTAILASCRDPRLRVIRLERNVGPGLAAQRGIDEARGEYILRADADDVQSPERFARQVAFLDAHPEVGIVGGMMRLLHGGHVRRRPLGHEACRVELLFNVPIFQPASAYRREVLVRNGIRYAQDWPWVGEDWLLQLELSKVTRLDNMDEVLVGYRQHTGGLTESDDKFARLAFLHTRSFAFFGLPSPTPEELALHAITCVKVFRSVPDWTMLRAFRAWLDHIRRWNDASGVFGRAVLHARLEEAWDELLYHMPRFGMRATLDYFRAGGRSTPAGAYYLLRTLLNPPNPTE